VAVAVGLQLSRRIPHAQVEFSEVPEYYACKAGDECRDCCRSACELAERRKGRSNGRTHTVCSKICYDYCGGMFLKPRAPSGLAVGPGDSPLSQKGDLVLRI
jgi:hypothetical protein